MGIRYSHKLTSRGKVASKVFATDIKQQCSTSKSGTKCLVNSMHHYLQLCKKLRNMTDGHAMHSVHVCLSGVSPPLPRC
jgi:hypothetical protein